MPLMCASRAQPGSLERIPRRAAPAEEVLGLDAVGTVPQARRRRMPGAHRATDPSKRPVVVAILDKCVGQSLNLASLEEQEGERQETRAPGAAERAGP
jgi:hypothetical protein